MKTGKYRGLVAWRRSRTKTRTHEACDDFGCMTAMVNTRDSEADFTALAAELVTGASLVSLDTTTKIFSGKNFAIIVSKNISSC